MQPDTAAPASEWHIASILVHLRPERREAVRAAAAVLPGTEIHVEEGGKMIVTVEGPHEGWIADRMTALHLLDGVLSAVLVFHHVEPVGGEPVGDSAAQRA